MDITLSRKTRRLLERIAQEDHCSIEQAIHLCALYILAEREPDPSVRRKLAIKLLREGSK